MVIGEFRLSFFLLMILVANQYSNVLFLLVCSYKQRLYLGLKVYQEIYNLKSKYQNTYVMFLLLKKVIFRIFKDIINGEPEKNKQLLRKSWDGE